MFSKAVLFAAFLMPLAGIMGQSYAPESLEPDPPTGTIVVKVIAFRNSAGSIMMSLYPERSTDVFPDIEGRVAKRHVRVVNSSVTEVVFENIPFGTYAIAGMHDENDNGEMDYNFIGMPKEGWCFSNDAKPILSPPPFRKAAFTLREKQKVVYATMQY